MSKKRYLLNETPRSQKKIREFFPYQIFLNNEKFVVQIEKFFWKWNLEIGTRYHFVSIDFHEFEIVGIITLTMKIFPMNDSFFITII